MFRADRRISILDGPDGGHHDARPGRWRRRPRRPHSHSQDGRVRLLLARVRPERGPALRHRRSRALRSRRLSLRQIQTKVVLTRLRLLPPRFPLIRTHHFIRR